MVDGREKLSFGHLLIKIYRYGLPSLINRATRTLVVEPHYSGGFFSNFNKVMNVIVNRQIYRHVRTIEVDWRTRYVKGSHFSYGRPEDGNLWTRLFAPLPYPKTPLGLTRRIRKYLDYSITGLHAYDLYHGDPSWRLTYNRAFNKCIRLQPHIYRRVQDFYNEHMAGRFCIGFHIRNDLHRVEMPQQRTPRIDDYCEKANAIIQSVDQEPVVFLASDVEEIVETFSKKTRADVIVQPGVERESIASGHQLHHGHPNPSLKLAEDVLIDCLLLSKCDTFVHVTSNLATAVGYINPHLRMVYLE